MINVTACGGGRVEQIRQCSTIRVLWIADVAIGFRWLPALALLPHGMTHNPFSGSALDLIQDRLLHGNSPFGSTTGWLFFSDWRTIRGCEVLKSEPSTSSFFLSYPCDHVQLALQQIKLEAVDAIHDVRLDQIELIKLFDQIFQQCYYYYCSSKQLFYPIQIVDPLEQCIEHKHGPTPSLPLGRCW